MKWQIGQHKAIRNVVVAAAALGMAAAPGLNLAVHRALKPDAIGLGGFLYQLIGRTLSDLGTDALSVALLFVVTLWLAKRYLFHKAKSTGAGEYVLSAFFSASMLACASIRATGSVQTLYENGFQVVKALLYLMGMLPLFLCALRALAELLRRPIAARRETVWDRHPFAFPAGVLGLSWGLQVAVKYPGVLSIDTVLQIKQYQGIIAPTTAHPVFGTFFYGWMHTVGQQLGHVNLAYFAVMLLQVAAMLLTLCYLLWQMKKGRAPFWMQALALGLFALSPIYIGWAVVIVKDTPFLTLTLLTGGLTLEFLRAPEAFLKRKSRWALLAAGLLLLVLTRYNGVYIAVPVLLVFIAVIGMRRVGRKTMLRFALMGCLVLALSFGVNEAIIRGLNVSRIQFFDWLSIPFQQTARVAALHGDTLTPQDKADVDTMLDYDQLATRYAPANADQVKWTLTAEERGTRSPERYLRVWCKQLFQYPMDYLDAMLNVNSVMLDLQANAPIYIGLSDPSLYEAIYPDSFCDMSYYESEAIQPLNAWQLALTEWYVRFSDLPGIGWFASMGFCVDLMLAIAYLSWVYRKKAVLAVMLPSLLTAAVGLFCSVVYTRYLLPTIGALPLWLAAYALLEPAADRIYASAAYEGASQRIEAQVTSLKKT